MDFEQFQKKVWNYYVQHGRDLPWRMPPFDAYNILVSELMLQQTRVSRVIPKYTEFLELFPTIQILAGATLAEVIKAWSGLGYNRRAKYVHDAAKSLAYTQRPWSLVGFTACKGIGYNTAAAIMTYAYNQPLAFIETNIRTVYIHHFFANSLDPISDMDILESVERTLVRDNPREFMWALMDYGSHLKSTTGNMARHSKHYTRQAVFEGSRRQMRGRVLRLLATGPKTPRELSIDIAEPFLKDILVSLTKDGLISLEERCYVLSI